MIMTEEVGIDLMIEKSQVLQNHIACFANNKFIIKNYKNAKAAKKLYKVASIANILDNY